MSFDFDLFCGCKLLGSVARRPYRPLEGVFLQVRWALLEKSHCLLVILDVSSLDLSCCNQSLIL